MNIGKFPFIRIAFLCFPFYVKSIKGMHFLDAHQTQKNREVPLSTVQQSYLEPK